MTLLICGDNQLTCLNVKNGNNSNFISFPTIVSFDATQNPNLTCIEVDDTTYSNANWTSIDPQTLFSTNCNNPCLLCSDTTISDTLIYYVASPAFSTISPILYLDSVQLLTTIIGGCDSIINHYSQFVYSATTCTDTIQMFDTTYVTVYDTVLAIVYDTTFVTIYDTVLTAVTDTLIMDVTLTGIPLPNNTNTMLVYPNPSSDFVIIDNGDYLSMSGYTLKIINSLGQEVFNSTINIPVFSIPVSTLGSVGTYYIQVFDTSPNIVQTKALILQ